MKKNSKNKATKSKKAKQKITAAQKRKIDIIVEVARAVVDDAVQDITNDLIAPNPVLQLQIALVNLQWALEEEDQQA